MFQGSKWIISTELAASVVIVLLLYLTDFKFTIHCTIQCTGCLLYYTVCTCIFCAVQAASVFPVLYKLQVYFFTVLLLVYFLYWTTETVKLFPVLYRLQVCSSCTQPPLRTMSLRRAVGKQYLARMWWVEYLIYNYKLHFN